MYPRSKALAAPRTERAFVLVARGMIKLHAKLRRPLENVEELSERQIQEGLNDRDGMQDREEAVERPAHPEGRNCQGQSRDGNREQQDERQEIHRERLHRLSAQVEHS